MTVGTEFRNYGESRSKRIVTRLGACSILRLESFKDLLLQLALFPHGDFSDLNEHYLIGGSL